MRDKIRNALKYVIEIMHNKRFVIYPFGQNGEIVKDILNNEFGIVERYIVDKYRSETDKGIFSLEYLKRDFKNDKDFIILLAVDPQSPNSVEVHQQLLDVVELSRVADILSPSMYFNPWSHFEPMWAHWDIRVSTIECIAREIYRNGVAGSIAEAGVFKGNTAKHMNILFPERKMYLFDTFEGFDVRDQESDDCKGIYNTKLDFSDTSIEEVMGKMCFLKNIIVKKGYFPESAKGIDEKFCFVRLDMDLYDPIYAGLHFFYPRMMKGGYICVHDCRSKNFDGARKALMDFCVEKHLNYMCMPDGFGTAVICIG